MPPFGFRKPESSASQASARQGKKADTTTKASLRKSRPTLFEDADATSKRNGTVQENRKFLDDLDDDDEDSALSDVDSDEFEDVPSAKRRKTGPSKIVTIAEDEDDEMDWEDAIPAATSSTAMTPSTSKIQDDEIGDISVSMNEDGSYIEPVVSAGLTKKGPSKRERQIRIQTHCLHVMALMWHNTVRNSWLNDKEVRNILVDGLPDGVQCEVKKWRGLMGSVRGEAVATDAEPTPAKWKGKGKGKQAKKGKKSDGRDWNTAAQSQATTNEQATNAFLRLLKVLTAYWRKRFTVTAPGIRKQGYKDLRRLQNEIKAWEKNHHDTEEHGERIENLQDFRKLAKECEGSRDTGNQLFAALLRGLGMEVRMVANLQPAGIGWSKAEEADAKKDKQSEPKTESAESDPEDEIKSAPTKPSSNTKKKGKEGLKAEKPTRKSSRGNKSDPIDLEDSDSPLSSPPSEAGNDNYVKDDDDMSVIEVVTSSKRKPNKKYDRDMAFPNYWTEVCDPVSHKYIPIDPVILSTIATSDELLQTFEPRGKKAETAKQVMCYTIAFCSDGTAKDVTVRYLKRHQLPGKTKGVRMPIERIPIYNRKGKVNKYEDYDWFHNLMLVYDRPDSRHTSADLLEDQTDLKPFRAEKQQKAVEKESLQGYKQSAEFVLEHHLRREEALLPGAEPVKTFTAGKGDKSVEHPVYLRSDVVVCKTVESWHKEGRAIKMGEQPLKYVPIRAVTLIRKREIEDAQRETGEKLKQGLYSEAQTDWIIPPPIENGVIPKNAFGNMDVYVPTMVPEGAVHLPLKGTAKICRKLEIDFAEACTGFEFGKQRAVPVLTGVVVAKENERLVTDAWRVQREEERRKEDTKRTAAALHWWRKMLLGLRVLERMRVEYADSGGNGEEVNPFVKKAEREGRAAPDVTAEAGIDDALGGGGFLLPGEEEESEEGHEDSNIGGFLVEDERADDTTGDGFLLDGDDEQPEPALSGSGNSHAPITPVSLQSIHKNTVRATDSDDETEAAPMTKHKKQTQDQWKPDSNGKKNSARKKVVESTDEGSSSELSEPSDRSPAEEDDDSSSDSPPALPPPPSINRSTMRNKQNSPQAIISPVKKMFTPSTTGRKPRAAKKATPVRSPYFDHSDDEGDGDSGGDEDDEIVLPRRTTARTRRKG
jgi:xeroderma pigmentosum group C-complementing protein